MKTSELILVVALLAVGAVLVGYALAPQMRPVATAEETPHRAAPAGASARRPLGEGPPGGPSVPPARAVAPLPQTTEPPVGDRGVEAADARSAELEQQPREEEAALSALAAGGAARRDGSPQPPASPAALVAGGVGRAAPVSAAAAAGVVAAKLAEPTTRAKVRLVPQALFAAVGQSVAVRVLIDGAAGVGSVPFHVGFDRRVLQFEQGRPGAFLGADGRQVVFMVAPAAAGDRVVVGLSRLGESAGVGGAGELCTLHFKTVGRGSAQLSFANASVRDGRNNVLPADFEGVAFVVN